MNKLGDTARLIREASGVTQKAAADMLGVTPVHLCNVEKGKSAPSMDLAERYRRVFGMDLYVVAWCLFGNVDSLPHGVREATQTLADAWRAQLRLNTQGLRGRGVGNLSAEATG